MNFDLKAQGIKPTLDRNFMKLLKPAGLMISASGISNTLFLPSNFEEFFDRFSLILQEKHTGNSSNKISDEKTTLVDKLLEYKMFVLETT